MSLSTINRLRVIVCFGALFAVGFFVVAAATPAWAHAIVQTTEPGIDEIVPEPPSRVVMRFNEPVELAFGALRVFDTHGERVDVGAADHLPGEPDAIQVPLPADLEDGTYTVTWRVVSADGHPIAEAFVFHVGAPGENPQGIAEQVLGSPRGGQLPALLFGVARWALFASLLLLAGAVIFLFWIWEKTPAREDPDTHGRFLGRWRKLVIGGWGVALLATIAALVLQGAVAGDLPLSEAASLEVIVEVGKTRFGKVAWLRLALLVVLAIGWIFFRARLKGSRSAGSEEPRQGSIPAWGQALVGIVVVALLATPGLAGHAGTSSPTALNLFADVLHLVAGAMWAGGLVVLLFAAFRSVRNEQESAARLAPVVARFSDMAVVAVAVIVATGVYRGWSEVRALRALTEATYGWVLLTKVGVFLPLLAIGWINNRVLKPRLTKAAAGNQPGQPLTVLKRLVTGEVVLIAVVLAVTALLVNLVPAKVEAGVTGPFIRDVRLATYNLNVLVDPNQVGENEIHLTATEPSGRAAPIKSMRVLLRLPDEGIGPLVAKGTRLAPGHFVVQGHQLSLAGEWLLEIVARTGRFDEARTQVRVPVNG